MIECQLYIFHYITKKRWIFMCIRNLLSIKPFKNIQQIVKKWELTDTVALIIYCDLLKTYVTIKND